MKIGVLFPGFADQFVGMGKELYDNSRIMQEYFEEASSCLPINFVKLCFASSDSELSRIEFGYPALFLTSTSIAAVLKEQGVTINEVAGFGIGQVSAMFAAGSLTLPDGLYILSKYAQLYQEALTSWNLAGMCIQQVDADIMEKMCEQYTSDKQSVSIAAYLPSNEYILTGNVGALKDLEEQAVEFKISTKSYPIEGGLFSPFMDPIIMHLKKYLEKIDFKDATSPFISAIKGKNISLHPEFKDDFIEQIHKPIRWDLVMKRCADWDIIIQVGPGKKLIEMAKKVYPDKALFAVNKQTDIDALKAHIAEKLQ